MPNADPSSTSQCPGDFRHPLEAIPIFRRVRPSIGRDVIYTVIWNSLFALFFTAMSMMIDSSTSIVDTLRITFVFAQCIGFVIYAVFLVTQKLFGAAIHRTSFWVRSAYYALAAIVGIFPGYLLAFRLLHWKNGAVWLFAPRTAVSIVIIALVITAVLILIFVPRERAARAEAAMAREQARVAAAEREATTARMKLLEAQVEPHFLYNTLAHVISLIDAEPRAAKHMIEGLIALLRASAVSAGGGATLGVQVDLLRAYLEIVALRMGSRLSWRIDVPASLREIEVAPMLLQPIVENAVKHGLEPSMTGGEVSIGARRELGKLFLTVTDTGAGFRPTAQAGIGLANLRARLAASYGDDARVTIEDVAPHGTRVTLVVPISGSAPTGVNPAHETLVASQ
ncbi:MAG TPA: histidine kinase [Casimicrobiaceae bacterium]|nr:histidine kinase [Casimicrobiaceae bacterium]